MMNLLQMSYSKWGSFLSLLVFSVIIGGLSSANAIITLLIFVVFTFAIITIFNPLKTTILVLSVWSIIQGFLASIYIAGYPASQLFIPLFLGLVSLAILVRKNVENEYLYLSMIYFAMVLWSSIGLAYTKFMDDALVSYLRLGVGWLIFHYLLTTISSRESNNRMADILITGGAISGLLTIIELVLYSKYGLQDVFGLSIVSEYYGGVFRPSGGFGGPVASAISLFSLYIISAYRYAQTKSMKHLIITILIFLGMCSTLTRTVIISLIVMFLLQAIYFSYFKRSIKPIIYTLGALIVVAVLIMTFAYEIVQGRLVDFIDTSGSESYGGGRLGIWYSIVEGIKTEGSLGSNILGYGISMSRYFVYQYSSFGLEDYTHNDFLDTFLSNGAIGFSILICFVCTVLKTIVCVKDVRIKISFGIPIIVYILLVMMVSNTQYSAGPRWMFLIVIVYAVKEVMFENSNRNL